MDECPTICDPDCEAGATHCGELHLPSYKRAHDPDSCFAETMDWAIRGVDPRPTPADDGAVAEASCNPGDRMTISQ